MKCLGYVAGAEPTFLKHAAFKSFILFTTLYLINNDKFFASWLPTYNIRKMLLNLGILELGI